MGRAIDPPTVIWSVDLGVRALFRSLRPVLRIRRAACSRPSRHLCLFFASDGKGGAGQTTNTRATLDVFCCEDPRPRRIIPGIGKGRALSFLVRILLTAGIKSAPV